MAFGLNQKREWLVAHYNDALPEDKVDSLNQLLKRLQNGEPLAYITGKRSFFGLDFKVNPDVLVPRPETELLVEEAVTWLEANPGRRPGVPTPDEDDRLAGEAALESDRRSDSGVWCSSAAASRLPIPLLWRGKAAGGAAWRRRRRLLDKREWSARIQLGAVGRSFGKLAGLGPFHVCT